MAQPIIFPSTTPNLELPLLYSGQAQKEFTLNQAFAALDAIAGKTVEGVFSAPPSDAAEGLCYLVGPGASAEWSDCSDCIAVRIAGGWHFVAPQEGFEVFDRSIDQKRVFRTGWEAGTAPAEPAGGSVVDAEARAAIVQLISAMQMAGVIGGSA